MTSKGEALAAVHAAMDSRLFGEGDWLADWESCKAVDRLLNEHGFLLRLSDSSLHSTALGKETDVDLLMCFLGLFYAWEVPDILHFRGYIDLEECEEIYEQLERGEPEQVLRPVVQKVWRRFCNPSGLLS
jgi:hypothetical protein